MPESTFFAGRTLTGMIRPLLAAGCLLIAGCADQQEPPVHLLTSASIAHMSEVSGEAFDPRRFRPNFVIDTLDEITGLAEFEWVDLEQNPKIAKSLYETTGRFFGASLSVVRGGRISRGDTVTVL